MHYIATRELPQGQQPGELFETTEAMGDVLIAVGAARVATPEEIKPPASRRYRRRDLEAAVEA